MKTPLCSLRTLAKTVSELQEELDRCRQERDGLQEAYLGQKQALERENDLLRDQLKKYVSMVQAQQKEGSESSPSGMCE